MYHVCHMLLIIMILCTDGTLYEECAHIHECIMYVIRVYVIVFVLFVFNVLEP